MKIKLIRHGPPVFDTARWIGVHEVQNSLQEYRVARVITAPINGCILATGNSPAYVMTSELARAQDSARLCTPEKPEITALLNEAELPHPKRLIFPLTWGLLLIVYRIGWLLGYRSNAPGLRRDMVRAQQAAELLVKRAAKHTYVYAYGHGIMNRLIIRELKKQGWSITTTTGRRYWSITTLKLRTSSSDSTHVE